MNDRLLKVGVVGSAVAAICCFTPILSGLLGIIGLAALADYLDIVLLPLLAGFLAITGYALWQRKQAK